MATMESRTDKRELLMWKYPGLWLAYDLYTHRDDNDLAMVIEARILAGQSDYEIAALNSKANAKQMTNVIRYYRKLFFDINEDELESRDYITTQVLYPAIRQAAARNATMAATTGSFNRSAAVVTPIMDSTLKFFAYFCGPYVLDELLTLFRSDARVTRPEDTGIAFTKAISGALKRRVAQSVNYFEINKFNVVDLLAVYTRVIEIEMKQEGQSSDSSVLEKHVNSFFSGLQWNFGKADRDKLQSGVLAEYDEENFELREHEIQTYAATGQSETLNGLPRYKLPQGRAVAPTFKKEAKE